MLNLSKETCIHPKEIYGRDLLTCIDYTDQNVINNKENLVYDEYDTLSLSKETYIRQKRPIYVKRDLYTSKETYIRQKKSVKETR